MSSNAGVQPVDPAVDPAKATENVTPRGDAKPAAPPAPAPKAEAPGTPAKESPWVKDWTDRGIEDPEGKLELYMREIQQPYVTRLEQQVQTAREVGDLFTGWETVDGESITPTQHAQLASGILKGLMENPSEAYLNLGVMFGVIDEEGNWLIEDGEDAEAEDDPATPRYNSLEDLDPARAKKMDEFFAKQEQDAEDAALNAVIDKYSQNDPEFDEDLFITALIRFQGDEEQAIRYYRRYAPKPTPKDKPLPTLGEGSNPPARPDHGDIRSAVRGLAGKLGAR